MHRHPKDQKDKAGSAVSTGTIKIKEGEPEHDVFVFHININMRKRKSGMRRSGYSVVSSTLNQAKAEQAGAYQANRPIRRPREATEQANHCLLASMGRRA